MIRKGRVWSDPPKKVMMPVIPPRTTGLPRPVSSPSSESASDKAMLIPAPVAAAIPTRKAVKGWWVANAVAKIGASVETEPSISPASPGCTTRSRKSRDVSSLVLTALISSAICPLTVGGVFSISCEEAEVLSILSATEV